MSSTQRMNQEERSEKSRTQILDAALSLFSHQGYHGTSMRDIARAAKMSTGAVYHQFPDKESIFNALLDRYWQAIESATTPFNEALADGVFPDDLEALGRAARETVEKYKEYVSLIYVDVVEFEGSHIRKFYSEMAKRFDDFFHSPDGKRSLDRMRSDVSPVSAIMVVSRFFFHYFATEIIFGVPNQFGKDTESVLKEVSEILKHGMLQPEPKRPERELQKAGARNP